jgi:hypothetical protein
VRSRRKIEPANELQSVRNLLEARERTRNIEDEHLHEPSGGILREFNRGVRDLEYSPHYLSTRNGTRRGGNGISSPSRFVRWGALGAMLAGLAWIVSAVIAIATGGGRGPEAFGFVPLNEALYGVALVGTLGGLVGMHLRQAPSYGRLGSVGFMVSFLGVSLVLLGLVLSFLAGRFLDQVLGLGFLGALIGFMLLGTATLSLGALPPWCGLLLAACLPLALILGQYSGPIALGLIWLALGCTLLLRRDLSTLFQFPKETGRFCNRLRNSR